MFVKICGSGATLIGLVLIIWVSEPIQTRSMGSVVLVIVHVLVCGVLVLLVMRRLLVYYLNIVLILMLFARFRVLLCLTFVLFVWWLKPRFFIIFCVENRRRNSNIPAIFSYILNIFCLFRNIFSSHLFGPLPLLSHNFSQEVRLCPIINLDLIPLPLPLPPPFLGIVNHNLLQRDIHTCIRWVTTFKNWFLTNSYSFH